jgi:hypothetical protein
MENNAVPLGLGSSESPKMDGWMDGMVFFFENFLPYSTGPRPLDEGWPYRRKGKKLSWISLSSLMRSPDLIQTLERGGNEVVLCVDNCL